jgi:hypothetical protein
LANFSNQIHDFNPGFGPAISQVDSGNGFGARVFWIAAIPDSDVTVNLAAGTAELHVHDLPEFDYNSFNDSDGPDWQHKQVDGYSHGYYDATVSFDVVWHGPVTNQVNVKDATAGFAGTFSQDYATVTWSASSTRPAGNANFTFTSNPGDFATSQAFAPGNYFVQLASERNASALYENDPANPSLTDLVVGGNASSGDHIQVTSVKGGQAIRVQIDSQDFAYRGDFPSAGISRLIVYGAPGDNHIEVAQDVTLPAILVGGDGNDLIQAGGGPTVVVAGGGDDHLIGGAASNILIGGASSDHLESTTGSDILIAGTTYFDNNVPALIALMSEWSRSDESYLQRVANLSNSTVNGVSPNGSGLNGSDFLNASTVHDVGSGNLLEGGAGLDWYFANLDGIGNNGVLDTVTGRKPGEILTTITL